MSKTPAQLVQISSLTDIPRAAMGVVSPCSTCKNKREEVKDGKPACPRLKLRKFVRDRAAVGQPLSPAFAPALLTGTEGTDQEGSDALRNPVYSDDQGHILVWAALLRENTGVFDEQGNVVVKPLSPPLADFDTDYIQCGALPYVVRKTEAEYFQLGAYKEWDLLECVSISHQMEIQVDGIENAFDELRVEGFANKVNFAYTFPRLPVDQDLHPRGT
jgi:hypothetical protein